VIILVHVQYGPEFGVRMAMKMRQGQFLYHDGFREAAA